MIWLYIGIAAVTVMGFFCLWVGWEVESENESPTLGKKIREGLSCGAFGAAAAAAISFIIGLIGNLVCMLVVDTTKSEFSRDLVSNGETHVSIRPEGEHNSPHYSYFLNDNVDGRSVLKNYSVYTDYASVVRSSAEPRITFKQECENEFWITSAGCSTVEYVFTIPPDESIPQAS